MFTSFLLKSSFKGTAPSRTKANKTKKNTKALKLTIAVFFRPRFEQSTLRISNLK